jgi:hypothetical protein
MSYPETSIDNRIAQAKKDDLAANAPIAAAQKEHDATVAKADKMKADAAEKLAKAKADAAKADAAKAKPAAPAPKTDETKK